MKESLLNLSSLTNECYYFASFKSELFGNLLFKIRFYFR